MSWPNRDGYYSFLMHLGPFGCIATAIFSENAILSKIRLEEKNSFHTSTAHPVQFSELLAIFHTPWGVQEVWKIAKKHNPLVKFCCGSVEKKLYFFQKIGFHFSKNCQNYNKKNSGHEKIKKLLPGTYILIYVLWNQ